MNETFDRAEALAIIQHFEGKQVTNDVLAEFCNLHGYEVIGVETYEDYKFAYEHDKHIDAILPAIFAQLSKIQNPPELSTPADRQRIIDANESIEEEIAYLCETYGILYQEVDILLGGLGALIKRTMDGANTRVNNMASRQLLRTAEEKFGKPMLISALGEAQRGGKPFRTNVQQKEEDAKAAEPVPAEAPAPAEVAPGSVADDAPASAEALG